jgi:predicted TIM-barrel fold metal-dependent hydrolase
MRIVTLEEHISFPEMSNKISKEALGGFGQSEVMQRIAPKLADITGERLDSMDANGITMQVLSVDSAGANLLSPEEGPAFAMQYNDLIAERNCRF